MFFLLSLNVASLLLGCQILLQVFIVGLIHDTNKDLSCLLLRTINTICLPVTSFIELRIVMPGMQ